MKKILAILLCILLVMALVACGGDKDNGDDETNPPVTDTTPETPTDTTPGTDTTEPSGSTEEQEPNEDIDLPAVGFED